MERMGRVSSEQNVNNRVLAEACGWQTPISQKVSLRVELLKCFYNEKKVVHTFATTKKLSTGKSSTKCGKNWTSRCIKSLKLNLIRWVLNDKHSKCEKIHSFFKKNKIAWMEQKSGF